MPRWNSRNLRYLSTSSSEERVVDPLVFNYANPPPLPPKVRSSMFKPTWISPTEVTRLEKEMDARFIEKHFFVRSYALSLSASQNESFSLFKSFNYMYLYRLIYRLIYEANLRERFNETHDIKRQTHGIFVDIKNYIFTSNEIWTQIINYNSILCKFCQN